MVKTFADALMSAEADALCNAEYGQVSNERVNHRNGYRSREWDTRAGTVEPAVPKLRQGSYVPHWLLERRRRAEQALSAPAPSRSRNPVPLTALRRTTGVTLQGTGTTSGGDTAPCITAP